MRTYACDWCRRSRNPGERWLLGFAAERIGAAGVQREMTMAARWTQAGAEHPLAVHFCSAEHRNAYVEALFSDIWGAKRTAPQAVTRTANQRSLGTVSLGLGCAAIQSGKQTASSPQRIQRAKPAKVKAKRPARAHFDFGDRIRSHGMGVRLDGAATKDAPPLG